MITFDPQAHAYTVNGKPAVSVTTALSVLQDWSRVDAELLQRAADFGTAVHRMVELYEQNDLDEGALDAKLKPYLDGYKAFRIAKDPRWEFVEVPVASEALRCAGTPDLIGLIGKTRWCIDIKSSAHVPVTVGAQTAAYVELAKETHGIRCAKRGCLILTPGGYKLTPLSEPSDYSLFVSALNCWRFIEKHHPKETRHAA